MDLHDIGGRNVNFVALVLQHLPHLVLHFGFDRGGDLVDVLESEELFLDLDSDSDRTPGNCLFIFFELLNTIN